ncbi:hypothetical protein CaCOL14_008716 [Colletotrichum acutatum]
MSPGGLVIKRLCRPLSNLGACQLQSRSCTTTNYNFHHTNPNTTIKMPTYIVTCKEDASADQVAAAKKHATDQGGKIGHEYSLIKGFSVEFPEDQISTLESHEHVKHVEKDQEVKTQ